MKSRLDRCLPPFAGVFLLLAAAGPTLAQGSAEPQGPDPAWWTLSDTISPATLQAVTENERQHRQRYGLATGSDPDTIAYFVNGAVDPELIPFWHALAALSGRLERDPGGEGTLMETLGARGLTRQGEDVVSFWLARLGVDEAVARAEIHDMTASYREMLSAAVAVLGDKAVETALEAGDFATLAKGAGLTLADAEARMTGAARDPAAEAAVPVLAALQTELSSADFGVLRSHLLEEVATHMHVQMAGPTGIEIFSWGYTRSEPQPSDPTRWLVWLDATFRFVGTPGLGDDIWVANCFLNHASDGAIGPLTAYHADHFGNAIHEPLDGFGDTISCETLPAAFPRCYAETQDVAFRGFGGAAVFRLGNPPIQPVHFAPDAAECLPHTPFEAEVTGLAAGSFVRIRNRTSLEGTPLPADIRTITSNGAHELDQVPVGALYEVAVTGTSPDIACSVSNGSGQAGTTPISVLVDCDCDGPACTSSFSVQVSISGASGNEMVNVEALFAADGEEPVTEVIAHQGSGSTAFNTLVSPGWVWEIGALAISNWDKECVASPVTGTVGTEPPTIEVFCDCSSGGSFCEETDGVDFPYPPPPDPFGICDPRWGVCSGGVPWWIVPEGGPPTGDDDCQRRTTCITLGTVYYPVDIDPNDGIGAELTCFEVTECVDSCIGGSGSKILNGPSVTLRSPTPGQNASGSLQVSGFATDSEGVEGLLFYVDLELVTLSDYSENGPGGAFSGVLDLTGLAPGEHTFHAVAVDRYPGYPAPSPYGIVFMVGEQPDISVAAAGSGTEILPGTTYDFGAWPVDEMPQVRTFLICNQGELPLTLTNHGTMVSGDGFTRDSSAGPASSVAPAACSQLKARFDSTAPGTHLGTVRIESDDPDEGTYSFGLEATLITPEGGPLLVVQDVVGGVETQTVIASGSSIDLGSTSPTLGLGDTVSLRNFGTETLVLSSPQVTGSCYWLAGPDTTPLPPSGGVWATVAFYCGDESPDYGSYEGVFTVASNDPAANPYSLSFTTEMVPNPNPRLWVKLMEGGVPGAPIFEGKTVALPATSAGVPTSLRFQVENLGGASLILTDPDALVSGTCFHQIETPTAVLAPGETSYFRVRLLCGSPSSYSGTVSIESTDPNRQPDGRLSFFLAGEVTP